jgi:hypothetical protein
MTEPEPEPGSDDVAGDDADDEEGPPEIVEAALAELENPADETNEG